MKLTATQLSYQQNIARDIVTKVITKTYETLRDDANGKLSTADAMKAARLTHKAVEQAIKPAIKAGYLTFDDIAAIAKQIGDDGGVAATVIIGTLCGIKVRADGPNADMINSTLEEMGV